MHTEDETFDLLGYLSRLARFWLPATLVSLLVLAAGIAATLLGGKGSTLTEHNAKAHVMVQPVDAKDAADADLQAQLIAQWMRTYVALEDVPQFIDPVVAEMGGKYTKEDVVSMTSVYWGGGSMLLAVNATTPDEADSLTMANALAKAVVTHGPEVVKLSKDKVPTMVLVEDAKIAEADDTTAAPPSMASRLVLPVGAAVAAWLATAFVLEARQSRRTRTE